MRQPAFERMLEEMKSATEHMIEFVTDWKDELDQMGTSFFTEEQQKRMDELGENLQKIVN